MDESSRLRKLITADGSETFFDDDIGEACHSGTGAAIEAMEKHARPAGLERLASGDFLLIYDVCFGLGYNTAAALDMVHVNNPSCRVEVHAFELDPEILQKTTEVSPPFKSYPLVRETAQKGHAENDLASITIHMGDVRKTLGSAPSPADAVFFDPFSPARAPELWTQEVFSMLIGKMRPGAALTTYSCARKVRETMRDAGFQVSDGPCIGRKAPSTIATRP
jgi:tRNA U34 5-methylaminomethyl-2-thiouridine-forming methyltransferase MnmC